MKDFVTDIGSVYWWVSVIIVGIIINLASDYLKTRLDTSVSRTSKWWRLKSDAQKAQRQSDIARLKGDSQEQILTAISEIRHQIKATVLLVFSVIFLASTILIGVLPQNDPMWWPLDTARVVWSAKIMKIILIILYNVTLLMSLSEVLNSRYDKGLLKDARTLADDQSAQHNKRVQPIADKSGSG